MSFARARPFVLLTLLYFLMFWSDVVAFRPGMDSMVYGTLAKHINTTGDWAVLHYTDQAYSNFYQHPPLGMWMMAISMKIVSAIAGPEAATANWVLKLLPSVMAALSIIGIYLWSKRIRGEAFAFLVTLILLTSTRFVKYSNCFMLDPFLATFSIWAIYTSILSYDSAKWRHSLSFLSGILITAAFLSKGMFAFAPLVVILFINLRRGGLTRLILFFLGLAVPFALWFKYGDAAYYISRYYSDHVAGRVGPHPLREHLEPLRNLAILYWPWLPFTLLGFAASAKGFFAVRRRDESAAVLTAFGFIGGFVLVGSFLEQYHATTYPFLAIVTAIGVPTAWLRYRDRAENVLLVIAVGFSIYLAFNPYSMHGTEYKNPIRVALKSAKKACKDVSIRRITISTGVAEIWYALGTGGWNTDWDTRSDAPERTPEESGSQLLLATATDPVGKGWVASSIEVEGLRVYHSATVADCGKVQRE